MKVTLARLLRLRTTLAGEITLATTRLTKVVVTTFIDNVPRKLDFDCSTCMTQVMQGKAKLRYIKTQGAIASATCMVAIPEFDKELVPESGTTVPVYQAVLIRDDIKAYRGLVSKLLDVQETQETQETGYGENRKVFLVVKKRNYDYQKLVEFHAAMQNWIDEIDGIIQGTDATYKIEVNLS